MTFTSDITVKLIQKMGGDSLIVAAARVSTAGVDTSSIDFSSHSGLINYLMKHRHGTPFEHSSLSFFVHAPIFVWREWHRHRIGFSYNEESARYRQLEPVFWVPRSDRKMIPIGTSARPVFESANVETHERVIHLLAESYSLAYANYEKMINKGIAREVARACLPVGIYSSCYVTCNPRSLMSFLSLRTHREDSTFLSYPQAEIEEAANAVESCLASGWPLTWEAFNKNGRVAP